MSQNIYRLMLQIPDGKLKEIFDRMGKARQELYDCCMELETLGVLEIKKDAANEGNVPKD